MDTPLTNRGSERSTRLRTKLIVTEIHIAKSRVFLFNIK